MIMGRLWSALGAQTTAQERLDRSEPGIRCDPTGLWAYTLTTEGHTASMKVRWRERGTLTIDGVEYDVVKQDWMRGRWSLQREEEELLRAEKRLSFKRIIDIHHADHQNFVLQLTSQWSRTMQLDHHDKTVARITPKFMSGAAFIETLDDNLDFTLLAFAFWLTVMLWRRPKVVS